MAKKWQQLVATAPTRSYQRMASAKCQLLARYVSHKAFSDAKDPSYLYTSGDLNRCNPEGVACIYFGEGSETARAEFDRNSKKPLTELGFYARTHLKAILDLTDPATRKHFGLKRIFESKAAHRRKLADLPIGEKLRLLDEMRERALTIQHARPIEGSVVREDPTPYRAKKLNRQDAKSAKEEEVRESK